MKRILSILCSFLLLVIPLLGNPAQKAYADITCGTLAPPKIEEIEQYGEINFHLDTQKLIPNTAYRVHFAGGTAEGGPAGTGQYDYGVTSNSDGSLDWKKTADQRYGNDNNNARFEIYNASNAKICSQPLQVNYISCTITIEQPQFTETTSPKIGQETFFHATGLFDRPGDTQYSVSFYLNNALVWQRRVPDEQLVGSDGSANSYPLGTLDGGHYEVDIRDRVAPLGDAPAADAKLLCIRGFDPTIDGGTVDSPTPSGAYNYQAKLLKLPCNSDTDCTEINTGLGKISTQPQGFVAWLLGFILSLAGGIVVLLIIASGYRLMTSQGDPEKIKAAREQLTAAIVGLLFIIFSLVILQAITVDIFHIPGFH